MLSEAPKYKKASYFAGALLLLVVGLFIYRPPYMHGGTRSTATVYPAVIIPVSPTGYWEFENPNPMASVPGYVNSPILPEGGSSNLTYSSTGGASGQYAIFTDVNGKYYTLGKTDLVFSPNNLGIEMALKPNQWYHDVNLISTADNSVKIWILADHHLTGTSAYRIAFTVNTTVGQKILNLDFDQIPPKAISAIFDGNWHHFFFKAKWNPVSSTGKMEIWVDGIKLASANLGGNVVLGSSKAIQINNGFGQTHRNYYGKMDSVRFYNVDVPENLIYEHMQNMKSGVNYSDTTNLTNIANTPALTAPFDPNDYLPGAILPSSTNNDHSQFTDYTSTPASVTTQLFSVPLPRYKTNTVLGRNVPINELTYLTMTGLTDHYSEGGAPLAYANRAVTIASEFAKKWNYYLDLRVIENSGPQPVELKKSPTCTPPCENFMGHLLEYANLNPQLPTMLGTNRAQESNVACGNENCLNYQGHPASAYLRNGAGQFVNKQGTVVSAPDKIWNPAASPSLFAPDGAKQITQLNQIVAKLPNRTAGKVIDLLVENGEVVHQYPDTVVVNNSNPAQPDPSLNSGYLASAFNGVANGIQKYLAYLLVQQETTSYRDPMLSIPQLNDTEYSMYAWDGWDTSTRFYWSEARKLLTPRNGQYYATTEMYTRWPWNWDAVYGPSNGAYYLRYAFNKQAATGDTFFAPYVAAGWNLNATMNITPGQWLGMLKNMANMGAEYFYPAYFNRVDKRECADGKDNDGDGLIDTNDPNCHSDGNPANPNSYEGMDNDEGGSTYDSPDGYQATKIWQFLTPSYAQAVFSRIDTLYKNSTVMAGDLPWDPNDVLITGIPGYSFKTGNPEDWVTVRKVNGQSKYIIAANKNQVTNMMGAVADTAPVTITLAGAPISFDIRPEGSVYLFDNTTPGTPVFYQLDKWHERKHPYRWSNDFAVEAEMYDSGSASIKTEGAGVATKNFTSGNYDTYINPTTGTTSYTVEPRNPSGGNAIETRYFWYRALSTSGAATANVSMNGANTKSLSTTATTYSWCNKDAAGNVISFPMTQNQANTFSFTGANANFHFDQFILSTSPSLGLGVCTGASNLPPTVSYIAPTPNNNATISGSVTLAANASDADGTIAEVSFTYNGPQSGLISQDMVSPYSTPWDTTSVPDGTYVLTAIAKDNLGATTTTSRTFIVANVIPNVAPTISYVSPTPSDGSTVNGAIGLYTTASDSDGTIANVVFSYSGPQSGQIFTDANPPYEAVWDTTIISDGSYNVTATATDNDGAQTSVTITLSVLNNPANIAPTINFIAPTPVGGSVLVGTVTLAANAADSDGTIDQVRFFYTGAAGGTIFIDTTSPYDTPWDTTSVPNGAYQIKATATDNDGGTKTVLRNVTVNNPTSNNAPTVSFTSPTPIDGSTVSGSVTLAANAIDSDGVVASVEFTYAGPNNGSLFIDTIAPYDTLWDTTSVADGTYIISAIATDNLGAQSTDTRTLVVDNGPADTVVPQITINAPLVDANLLMKISTDVQTYASDNVGVTEVKIYMGNTLKCTIPVTSQPTISSSCVFQVPWWFWAYNFTIKAEAYDAAGNMGSTIIGVHAV